MATKRAADGKLQSGNYVRVLTHYCEMSMRVGCVQEISDTLGDPMPVMVRFIHNKRLWPFAHAELEYLGTVKPEVGDDGYLKREATHARDWAAESGR